LVWLFEPGRRTTAASGPRARGAFHGAALTAASLPRRLPRQARRSPQASPAVDAASTDGGRAGRLLRSPTTVAPSRSVRCVTQGYVVEDRRRTRRWSSTAALARGATSPGAAPWTGRDDLSGPHRHHPGARRDHGRQDRSGS
jgi:hypothetical protein